MVESNDKVPRSTERKSRTPLNNRQRGVIVALTWVLGAVVLAALFAFKEVQSSQSQSLPLPHLGEIPTFTMRDQTGATVTDRDFRNRVSIVDFFFTSCPVMCPKLAARMADLRDRLGARGLSSKRHIQLASISVDPENDTPDKLLQYGAKFNAEPSSWSFLSGEAGDLHRIVVDGFKTEYKKAEPSLGIAEIMHGNWFILVDATGAFRGYYLADQSPEIVRLMLDAQSLAN